MPFLSQSVLVWSSASGSGISICSILDQKTGSVLPGRLATHRPALSFSAKYSGWSTWMPRVRKSARRGWVMVSVRLVLRVTLREAVSTLVTRTM